MDMFPELLYESDTFVSDEEDSDVDCVREEVQAGNLVGFAFEPLAETWASSTPITQQAISKSSQQPEQAERGGQSPEEW